MNMKLKNKFLKIEIILMYLYSFKLKKYNQKLIIIIIIIIAQIREKIYYSLTSRGLFPDEQKGCRKGSRCTAELLYIDQHILNESKTRRKNLAMAWIDNKKAYDMLPQSWILHCLKMYKISHEVINFIEQTMNTWRVELTTGGRSNAETKIQRDIF